METEIKERKRPKFLHDKTDYEKGGILTYNRRFDAIRQDANKWEAQKQQESILVESSAVISLKSNGGE